MKMILAAVVGGLIVWAVMAQQHKASLARANLAQANQAERQPTLAEQEQCARQAAVEFRREGYAEKDIADFTDHYSPKLGKCFEEVRYTFMAGKVPNVSRTVFDAFEGNTVARYGWSNPQGKQWYEVQPYDCTVNGVTCKSSDEFDALVLTNYGIDTDK